MHNNISSLTYRSDVDGLRAIAVLAVLLYHAFPKVITGGFVGVDVFFVISGFLISTIIFTKLDQNTFSFKEFYARRVKRLYPALLLVLSACLVYGWFVLLIDEFVSLGKNAAVSSIFASNFLLAKKVGYFDLSTDHKPLIHLWSLGIEEQFYILWPLALYFAKKRQFSIPRLILGALFISFLLNMIFIGKSPTKVFYYPFTRFWELLIGSGLAYICLYKKRAMEAFLTRTVATLRLKDSNHVNHMLSALGFCLILGAAVLFNRNMQYPGWRALLPTVGASLIILAGTHAWINTRILGSRPLVAIGLISYPLYLWHWPLLSFARIIEPGDVPLATIFILILASFVLAQLTYMLFETPIRRQPNSAAGPLLGGMLPVALFGFLGYIGVISPAVIHHPEVKFMAEAIEDWGFPGKNLKSIDYQGRNFYTQGTGEEIVLFMGDSNMQQYYPRVDRLISDGKCKNKTAVFATYPSCPPIPKVREHEGHPRVTGLPEKALEYARDPRVKTVVLGAQWTGYSKGTGYYYEENGKREIIEEGSRGQELAFAELKRVLVDLKSQGKQVYIILNIPLDLASCPRRMISRNYLGQWKPSFTDFNKEKWLLSSERLMSRLRKIAKEAGVTVIDPVDFLCDDAKCRTLMDNREPIYMDMLHLRKKFVDQHATFIDKVLL